MRKFIKIISFLTMVLLFLIIFNKVFQRKQAEADTWKIFYEQERDTDDVLVIGSSHAFSSINPAILYNDYGIACFDLCSAGLYIPAEFYYLKEAFKTQSPKVVLIDITQFAALEDTTSERKNLWCGGMRLSINKYEFVKEMCGTDWVPYIFQYPYIHSRYNGDLYERDFLPYRGDRYHKYYKGNRVFWETVTEEETKEDYYNTSESQEPPEEIIYYLEQIIKLADSNGAEVILYSSPAFIYNEAEQKHINWIGRWVDDQQVRLVDLNAVRSDIDIDMQTDMSDREHVNYLGQEKTSAYIGNLLKQNYDLPDRRQDKKYDSWQMWAEDYYNAYYAYTLAQNVECMESYIDRLINRDYTILINISGENTRNELLKNNVLQRLGVELTEQESSIYIINGSEIDPAPVLHQDFDYGRHVVSVDEHGFVYDFIVCQFAEETVSFAVFDNKNKAIIEFRSYGYNSSDSTWELEAEDHWMQGVWNKM